MNIFQYEGVDLSEVVARLPSDERNVLPFGLVKLDKTGLILEYNMAEAEISGIRPQDVIGKNFFLDVAICTQRPEFYGIFRQAMDGSGFINQIFNYEFQNARYAAVHEPVKVKVHMFSGPDSSGQQIVWVMVKRLDKGIAADQIDVASSTKKITTESIFINQASNASTNNMVVNSKNRTDTGNDSGDIFIDMSL